MVRRIFFALALSSSLAAGESRSGLALTPWLYAHPGSGEVRLFLPSGLRLEVGDPVDAGGKAYLPVRTPGGLDGYVEEAGVRRMGKGLLFIPRSVLEVEGERFSPYHAYPAALVREGNGSAWYAVRETGTEARPLALPPTIDAAFSLETGAPVPYPLWKMEPERVEWECGVALPEKALERRKWDFGLDDESLALFSKKGGGGRISFWHLEKEGEERFRVAVFRGNDCKGGSLSYRFIAGRKAVVLDGKSTKGWGLPRGLRAPVRIGSAEEELRFRTRWEEALEAAGFPDDPEVRRALVELAVMLAVKVESPEATGGE